MAGRVLDGLQITARCDTCDEDETAFLVGTGPRPVPQALMPCWSSRHPGHRQVVKAERGTLVVQ
jgi:hypothetical protein